MDMLWQSSTHVGIEIGHLLDGQLDDLHPLYDCLFDLLPISANVIHFWCILWMYINNGRRLIQVTYLNMQNDADIGKVNQIDQLSIFGHRPWSFQIYITSRLAPFSCQITRVDVVVQLPSHVTRLVPILANILATTSRLLISAYFISIFPPSIIISNVARLLAPENRKFGWKSGECVITTRISAETFHVLMTMRFPLDVNRYLIGQQSMLFLQ